MRKSVLSPEKRATLPASAFALPGRRYPIYDLYHGRLALIYVLSPSNAASRDRVVNAVLARYPELRAFWAEKSRERRVTANPSEFHLMRHSRHNPANFEYVENPYGIEVNVPVIRVSARTGGHRALAGGSAARSHFNSGERTHALNPKTGFALCSAGKGKPSHIHPSEATLVTCYRCIKVFRLMRDQRQAFTDRNIKPSSATKREKHVMIVGGREGQFIGRKEKREGVKYKAAPLGSMKSAGRFGPSDVSEFRRGSDLHPTQTRLAGGRVAPRKETARERKAREARAGQVNVYDERMDNPRHGSAARTAGLAKGQNLMQQAAKAYHAGEYDSMSEALRGVAAKRRR